MALGSESFLLTSGEDDYVFQSNTYTATPIIRTSIRESLENNDGKVEFFLPVSHPFVTAYKGVTPGKLATVTVVKVHRDDPDLEGRTIYKGIIRNISFIKNGNQAQISSIFFTRWRGRQIPRRTYQGNCNHMLFDDLCKLSDTDPSFEKFLNISADTGITITADGAGAFGSDFFETGFAEFDGEFRLIVAQSTDVLTLILPFSNSPLNQSIRIVTGCKHRLSADCIGKFSNEINFGGFPYVPRKNPFVVGID